MKKSILTAMTTLALVSGNVFSPPQAEASDIHPFKDVTSNHWASSSIANAVQNGFLKGYTDGTFKPSSPVTKAEMAVILGRLPEQPTVASEPIPAFSDIPAWAQEGVKAAIGKGFIDPTAYAGKLNANAELSRGEMATWLAQGLASANADYKTALSEVTDTVIPAKEYFLGTIPAAQKNAIALTMGTGLMSVANDKTFGSDRPITRAEVAALVERYLSVAQNQPADFQALQELRAVGLTGSNYKIIAPKYHIYPEEKLPSYDYSKFTDDFAKIRNKELTTRTDNASIKVKNWIVVNPYVTGGKRSVYYPVFVDEGSTPLNGDYYSFAEFDIANKRESMTILQAGGLTDSSTINSLTSPASKAFQAYGAPAANDFTGPRGVITDKNPHYWGRGLLHFTQDIHTYVWLTAIDGTQFFITPNY